MDFNNLMEMASEVKKTNEYAVSLEKKYKENKDKKEQEIWSKIAYEVKKLSQILVAAGFENVVVKGEYISWRLSYGNLSYYAFPRISDEWIKFHDTFNIFKSCSCWTSFQRYLSEEKEVIKIVNLFMNDNDEFKNEIQRWQKDIEKLFINKLKKSNDSIEKYS